MNFVAQYLAEAAQVAARIDHAAVESLVDLLADTRDGGGRLFVLGVGGSAGNASHAVNDFRKIAGFEAYAPTDNVSELTARINDDGWDTAFANWLTAHAEAFQAVVWHMLVAHPRIQAAPMRWESLTR